MMYGNEHIYTSKLGFINIVVKKPERYIFWRYIILKQLCTRNIGIPLNLFYSQYPK